MAQKGKTLWALATGILLMFLLAGSAGAQDTIRVDEWPLFADPDGQYSLRVPPTWQSSLVFENPPGPAYLIQRRVAFSTSTSVLVEIDAWQKPTATPIEDWFRSVEGRTAPAESNAVVSGQPAYLLIDPGGCGVPPSASLYVASSTHIFKIAYLPAPGQDALAQFQAMLASFVLTESTAPTQVQTALPDMTPLIPLDCGTNLCPSTCWGGCTFAAISEGCCGYHAISRWQCSKVCDGDQPGDFNGNCVWWGAYTRRDVGNLARGNAENWAISVRNTGQLPVDRTPKVGDIVVHPGTSYNHVAYVVWVSADHTRYSLSDMGWCADCGPNPEEIKARTVDADDEFIHCAGDPVLLSTEWTFTNCPFGWTPSKGFSATALDGAVWSLNPSQDPYLLSPILSLAAEEHDGIELRLSSAAQNTQGKIYFTTQASPSFDEAKSIPFALTNDGQMHDYQILTRGNPYWTGTITRIRLDPVDHGNSDNSLDQIHLASIAVAGRIGDSVPPAPAANVRPLGWSGPFTNDTTPTFCWDAASDDPGGSGLAGYLAAVDDWTPDGALDNDGWLGNVVSHTVTAPLSDGDHVFAVTSRDHEGNTNPANTNQPGAAPYYEFAVDLFGPAPPTILVSGPDCLEAPNSTWQNRCAQPAYTWDTTDAGSGVRDYVYYWGADPAGTPVTVTMTNSLGATVSSPAAAEYSAQFLHVVAFDPLGQASGRSTFGLFYDAVPPRAEITINEGAEWTPNRSAMLHLSATDAGSGVVDAHLSSDGQTWTAWTPYRATLPWFLAASDLEEHAIYAQVRDRAGNVSPVVSDTIRLDLDPLAPHSGSYRLCLGNPSAGGSGQVSSDHYSLVTSIGEPICSSRAFQASASYSLSSGFLSDLSGCLPITRSAEAILAPMAQPQGPATDTETPVHAPETLAQPNRFGIVLNEDAAFTRDRWVVVTSQAPNARLMRLSDQPDLANDGWTPYRSEAQWQLPSQQSSALPQFVYAWFRDDENRVYGPYMDSILLDTQPPEGLVLYQENGASPALLLLEAADDVSGLAQMRVGDTPSLTGIDWQPYTPALTWPAGQRGVYAQFSDRAGNVSDIYRSGILYVNYLPLVQRSQ